MNFDGFIRVYTEGRDDGTRRARTKRTRAGPLPALREGDVLKLLELIPEQHFTAAAAALLAGVAHQGARGEGHRPAVDVRDDRRHDPEPRVRHEDQSERLRPTELGFLVTDLLVDSFPDILNVEFTAGMEDELDAIEEGREKWVVAIRRFYEPFEKDLARSRREDARRQGRRAEDRPRMREVRRADGHQMGTKRRVPRVLGLSGM